MDIDTSVLIRFAVVIVALIIVVAVSGKWKLKLNKNLGRSRPTPLLALFLWAGFCLLEWMVTGEITVKGVNKTTGWVIFIWIIFVVLDLWSGWVFGGQTGKPNDDSPATRRQKNRAASGFLLAIISCYGSALALQDNGLLGRLSTLGGLGLVTIGIILVVRNYRLTPGGDAAADSRVNLALAFVAGFGSYIVIICGMEFLEAPSISGWLMLAGLGLIIGIFYCVFRGLLKRPIVDPGRQHDPAEEPVATDEPPAADTESTEPADE